MRLGILASEMEGRPTGVGRFVEGLLTGLASAGFDGETHLFFRGDPFEHDRWSDPRVRLHFAGRPGLSSVVWEQALLPPRLRGLRLDVLCGPAYSLPPGLRCASMVALHDLSFEVLPEEFGPRERFRRRFLARRAAARADRVLTLSRQVARQIEERYGIASHRIDVLPLAVDGAKFAPVARGRPAPGPPAVTGSAALRDGNPRGATFDVAPPYLVYLGSVLPRRRMDLVLEAFAGLARDRAELRLVIAGANRLPRPEALDEWIDRFDVRGRVIDLGWVPDRDLAPLLSGAELSFYLSTYEGYGLPPLESLAAGTAAVVSRGLGLDEVLPDYPFRCARLDAAEIERTARLALDNRALRQEVVASARERIRALTWEACARRFLESAERAMADARSVRGQEASLHP